MGMPKRSHPVKLIIGFIFSEKETYPKVIKILQKRFGKIDYESPCLAFEYTGYYQNELGKGQIRIFISFKKLIKPEALAKIKLFTNRVENKFSSSGRRRINIDPGYLDPAKLVLASTKDYNHRIYLQRGIFAEITLTFQGGTFRPWEWSYPDYQTKEYAEIFNKIREIYMGETRRK